MSIEVKITDNSRDFIEALPKAIQRGLWAIGATAEGHAKENCPVDTGRLRNSITFITSTKRSSGTAPAKPSDYAAKGAVTENNEVYIGTNVEYAPFVEEGSRRNRATHFLRDACTNHGDEYKKLMRESLENA